MAPTLPPWYFDMEAVPRVRIVSRAECTVGDDGNIPCPPAAMLAHANAQLKNKITMDEYALARMLASEYDSGSSVEKAALAWSARNEAHNKWGGSVQNMLLYSPSGGRQFGDQRQGRWADTRQDPTILDLAVAKAVLKGRLTELQRSIDFFDPTTQDTLHRSDPVNYPQTAAQYIKSEAAEGKVWIGRIPGINARNLMVFRQQLWSDDPDMILADALKWGEYDDLAKAIDDTTTVAPKYPIGKALPTTAGGGIVGVIVALFL